MNDQRSLLTRAHCVWCPHWCEDADPVALAEAMNRHYDTAHVGQIAALGYPITARKQPLSDEVDAGQ